MTAARLTTAEARALGISGLPPAPGARASRTRKRTTQRVVKGAAYHTQCVMCGEDFNSIAAEDRHLAETSHPRYALVLGYGTSTALDVER